MASLVNGKTFGPRSACTSPTTIFAAFTKAFVLLPQCKPESLIAFGTLGNCWSTSPGTLIARMDSKDLFGLVWMFVVSAITVLSASVAAVMSIERTLGRPIPKLPDTLPVKRNRAFGVVLICMAVGFLALGGMLQMTVCSDCERPYAWQSPVTVLVFSIIALAFSSVIGWILFAALWVASSSWRFVSRLKPGIESRRARSFQAGATALCRAPGRASWRRRPRSSRATWRAR